jgi:hypothetical protein
MSELISLSRMSLRAGVTQRWLREQADAGIVPCLKADRRYLFSPIAVMEALAARASQVSSKEGAAQ